MSKKDQILERLRSKWEDWDDVRKQVLDSVGWAKNSVEKKAKDIVEHSKNNPIVQNHVLPLMDNKKVKQAIHQVQDTIESTQKNVQKYKDKYIEKWTSHQDNDSSKEAPQDTDHNILADQINVLKSQAFKVAKETITHLSKYPQTTKKPQKQTTSKKAKPSTNAKKAKQSSSKTKKRSSSK